MAHFFLAFPMKLKERHMKGT